MTKESARSWSYTAQEISAASRFADVASGRIAELATQLSINYASVFDAAARAVMRREIADRIYLIRATDAEIGAVDEIWTAGHDDALVPGEPMPGRCVYRQWVHMDGTRMSIASGWLS